MLTLSIVLISLALVSYTVGIWAEKLSGHLKPWHAAAFTVGLIFDAAGTYAMKLISDAGGQLTGGAAGPLSTAMAFTGALALGLMAIHAAWAIVVLGRNRASELATFHKLSLIVWAIWLVPYFTGMAAAMLSQ